jgi:hypothetical protein
MNTREIIRSREEPMILSRSSDPTKRMQESVQYRGNPLAHTSAIYNHGMQGEFRTDPPRIDWGK